MRTNCPTITVMYLVGCKIDLESAREVATIEAATFASDNNCHAIECSAKTGANVQELFDNVAKLLWEHYHH